MILDSWISDLKKIASYFIYTYTYYISFHNVNLFNILLIIFFILFLILSLLLICNFDFIYINFQFF